MKMGPTDPPISTPPPLPSPQGMEHRTGSYQHAVTDREVLDIVFNMQMRDLAQAKEGRVLEQVPPAGGGGVTRTGPGVARNRGWRGLGGCIGLVSVLVSS
jgi:hypothetical protein